MRPLGVNSVRILTNIRAYPEETWYKKLTLTASCLAIFCRANLKQDKEPPGALGQRLTRPAGSCAG